MGYVYMYMYVHIDLMCKICVVQVLHVCFVQDVRYDGFEPVSYTYQT